MTDKQWEYESTYMNLMDIKMFAHTIALLKTYRTPEHDGVDNGNMAYSFGYILLKLDILT